MTWFSRPRVTSDPGSGDRFLVAHSALLQFAFITALTQIKGLVVVLVFAALTQTQGLIAVVVCFASDVVSSGFSGVPCATGHIGPTQGTVDVVALSPSL